MSNRGAELLQDVTERTSQLLMSRCKSVIWGLLERPRNRALKEEIGRKD